MAAPGHPVRRRGPGLVGHGGTTARVGADDPPAAVVGAHNLYGLAGATAVGGTWTVCNGTIHVTSAEEDITT
jgi:hypothetical protein